ncbi:uncharacterized protein MONBRDRAFT_15403 [Monosiga brevicollis MX1]|uniref:Protein kinase domain-containing protein n=1 Tax=Monosiga brevicollis TaxID=81824 RepID=A9UT91_MONBE|nr:uncharacterized protein MONBRDRAFT_15403 [Monosiga brevicollis MX1]EDQ91452.1 predicted protein [Monosiga brevicollis MX1]|eukprot:XP_001743874.1 hypothetical protein [Monosiga brevicollis MX1]
MQQGNFGDFFRGRYTEISGKQLDVAIKTLKSEDDDEKAPRYFLLEAQIMMEFKHDNVLRLIGVVTSEKPWCIVTELCELGDLRSLLRKLKQEQFVLNVEERLRMMGNIAAGMHYLATKQFIHRDLAARNCLVDSNAIIKIGDFGMTRQILEDEDYYFVDKDDALPLRWMAIESLDTRKFTLKTDVWSFGVVCHEIFTYGDMPYKGVSNDVLPLQLMNGLRLPIPDDCPDNVYAMMRTCWYENPDERPSFKYVPSDPCCNKSAHPAVS